jgi:hypothetical protein
VGWKLQPAVGTVVGEMERESWYAVSEREIQLDDYWNQPDTHRRGEESRGCNFNLR